MGGPHYGQEWDPGAGGARGLELVFVSHDSTAAEAQEYMDESHGTWLNVDFNDSMTREALSKKYVRGGTPALVVIHESSGEVISARGKDEVLKADGMLRWDTECFDDWRAATDAGPSQVDDFAAKANDALLGAAVSAASFLARAGAKAAEHVPQLSEEEKNQKMSLAGRAALSSAGTAASVGMFMAGGSIAKAGTAVKVGKKVNDVQQNGLIQGKAGKALALANKTGLADSPEALTLKRSSTGTASKIFASLSEAADIVAAGANKGATEAVSARYGDDVGQRISEALPGDKEAAVVLPVAPGVGSAAAALPAAAGVAGAVSVASASAEPEPEPEPKLETCSEPKPEPELQTEPEPEPEAPEGDPESMFRRCSWCTEHTAHSIKTRNDRKTPAGLTLKGKPVELKLRRSVYSCDGCGKDTLACKGCDKTRPLEPGMAKDTPMYSHAKCVVCKGGLKAWPDETIQRRCSWCEYALRSPPQCDSRDALTDCLRLQAWSALSTRSRCGAKLSVYGGVSTAVTDAVRTQSRARRV